MKSKKSSIQSAPTVLSLNDSQRLARFFELLMTIDNVTTRGFMNITKVELLLIKPQNGLMAFAYVEINHQFYVSSIGVHKRLDGQGYRITYPTRKVGEQNHTIFHPTKPTFSKAIKQAICTKAEELMGP